MDYLKKLNNPNICMVIMRSKNKVGAAFRALSAGHHHYYAPHAVTLWS